MNRQIFEASVYGRAGPPLLLQVRVQVFQAGSDQPLVLGAAVKAAPLQAGAVGADFSGVWIDYDGL